MNKSRTQIADILSHIEPWDDLERHDMADVSTWVATTDDIYRRQSPDVPNKHLVSYFVVVDQARTSLLLLDHIKAGLWLPPGGHVESGEDPRMAVERELNEELGPRAAMVATVAHVPLFVTVTQTRGLGSHTDVSLWYVVAGDEHMWLEPDPGEFKAHRWQSFESVLATDIATLDPQMHRFTRKLMARVER